MEEGDDALGLEEERDMVERGDVVHTDDLVLANMAEHTDLLLSGRLEGTRDNETAGNLWV